MKDKYFNLTAFENTVRRAGEMGYKIDPNSNPFEPKFKKGNETFRVGLSDGDLNLVKMTQIPKVNIPNT